MLYPSCSTVFSDDDGHQLVRHLSEVGLGALRGMWLERAQPSHDAMRRCLKHTQTWSDDLLRQELQRHKMHHHTLEELVASKFAKYYASTRPTRARPVRVTPPPMVAVCRALFAALRTHPHTLAVVVPKQPLLHNWRVVTADCLLDAFESLLVSDGYVRPVAAPPPSSPPPSRDAGSVIVGETEDTPPEEEKENESPPPSPSPKNLNDDDDIDPSDSVSNIGAPPAAADDDAVSVVLVG